MNKIEELPICQICGQEYDPLLELCQKYHRGNICFDCSREAFEAEIGYGEVKIDNDEDIWE